MRVSREVQHIDGPFVEIGTGHYHWIGSDDFTGITEDIVDVVIRSGRRVVPAWTNKWTAVAPGIAARRVARVEQLRIEPAACPVQVHFVQVTRYLSSAPEFDRRSAFARLVTYVSRSTTASDLLMFNVRSRIFSCASWLRRDRLQDAGPSA